MRTQNGQKLRVKYMFQSCTVFLKHLLSKYGHQQLLTAFIYLWENLEAWNQKTEHCSRVLKCTRSDHVYVENVTM